MQLTVLTDRSQGGSSLSDGSLELMVSGQNPIRARLVTSTPCWTLEAALSQFCACG
jgi:hypothetical protein